MVAPAKANAVCPDGNDTLSVPSGRLLCMDRFSKKVVPEVKATEAAELTSSRFHELAPSTPAALITYVAVKGANRK